MHTLHVLTRARLSCCFMMSSPWGRAPSVPFVCMLWLLIRNFFWKFRDSPKANRRLRQPSIGSNRHCWLYLVQCRVLCSNGMGHGSMMLWWRTVDRLFDKYCAKGSMQALGIVCQCQYRFDTPTVRSVSHAVFLLRTHMHANVPHAFGNRNWYYKYSRPISLWSGSQEIFVKTSSENTVQCLSCHKLISTHFWFERLVRIISYDYP